MMVITISIARTWYSLHAMDDTGIRVSVSSCVASSVAIATVIDGKDMGVGIHSRDSMSMSMSMSMSIGSSLGTQGCVDVTTAEHHTVSRAQMTTEVGQLLL